MMKAVRTILIAIVGTIGGSLAGGAAGGAVLTMISAFPDLSRAISFSAALGGLGIYLGSIFAMATLGMMAGVLLGSVPTLVLGTILSGLKRFRLFQRLLVWAATGLIVAVLLHVWFRYGQSSLPLDRRRVIAWTMAWAAGGAASMSFFWVLVVGGQRKQGKVTPSAPVR